MRSIIRYFLCAAIVAACIGGAPRPAAAQFRDSLAVSLSPRSLPTAGIDTAPSVDHRASTSTTTSIRNYARPATNDATAHARDDLSAWQHLGIGVLAGALAGGAFGYWQDSRSTCECMIPGVVLGVPPGALIGLLIGGYVYLERRG